MTTLYIDKRTIDGEFAVTFLGDYTLLISLKDLKSPQVVKVEAGHRKDVVTLENPYTITTIFQEPDLVTLIGTALIAGFSNCLSLYHEDGKFHWMVAEEITNESHKSILFSDWEFTHHEKNNRHYLTIDMIGKFITIGDHDPERPRAALFRSICGPISNLTPIIDNNEKAKDAKALGFTKPLTVKHTLQ